MISDICIEYYADETELVPGESDESFCDDVISDSYADWASCIGATTGWGNAGWVFGRQRSPAHAGLQGASEELLQELCSPSELASSAIQINGVLHIYELALINISARLMPFALSSWAALRARQGSATEVTFVLNSWDKYSCLDPFPGEFLCRVFELFALGVLTSKSDANAICSSKTIGFTGESST